MPRRRLLVAALAVVVAAVVAGALLAGRFDDESGPVASRGAPLASFDKITSGVALMQALDCEGKPLVVSDGVTEHVVSGSGFLVGSRVLMGVEHMVPPQPGIICGFRARLGGRWYEVADIKVWSERGEADRRGIDLATATLAEEAPGHIFQFAPETVPVGATLTLLSHPLGGPLRESKVVVTKKLLDYGKPTLAAKITPVVEGGDSGGPIVNDRGEIITVLSRTVVTANLSSDGSARYGGIDIPPWWGESVHVDLCRTYPNGGIPDCEDAEGEAAKVPVDVLLEATG